MPQTDTYIEKDTEINEKIEKMRLEATCNVIIWRTDNYCCDSIMYIFTWFTYRMERTINHFKERDEYKKKSNHP